MVTSSVYARVVRRFFPWMLLAAVVCGGQGVLIGTLLPKQYVATALSLVRPADGASTDVNYQPSDLITAAANNLAAIATSDPILASAAARAGMDATAITADDLSVEIPTNTALLQITVTLRSAEGSAEFANALADELSLSLAKIAPRIKGVPTLELVAVAPADVPSESSNPPTVLIVAAGALVGAAIAFAVGLIIHVASRQIRDARSAGELSNRPVLGSIDLSLDPARVRAGFARVLARARLNDANHRIDFLAVLPVGQSAGHAELAMGLAAMAADEGQRVLLIDGDLRGGATSVHLDMDDQPGLVDMLVNSTAKRVPTVRLPDTEYDILPVGRAKLKPTKLLHSARATEVLQHFRDSYDLVLVAGPSATDATEVVFWASATGAVMLSIAARSCDVDDVLYALDLVDDDALLGLAVLEKSRGG